MGPASTRVVIVGEGERIKAQVTVWAAGRVGPPLAGQIEALAANDQRRWRVRPTLQSLASDDIFAMGDCADIDNASAPPTAQAASQQATHLASELPRYCAGQTPRPFEYRDKGTLMSLGAAGSVGRIRGLFGRDLRVHGRAALTAYRGLERQHEWIVLGPIPAGGRLFMDLFKSTEEPRLKVH